MNQIKSKLESYKKEFKQNEITVPLTLIVEVLEEINTELKNITNKLYE